MSPPINHRHGTNVVQVRGRGVRAQLREALESRAPVRVAREKISSGWTHGYVIGLSAEFALIAEVSDAMHFDGFLVVAVGDVSAVEEDPGREFVEQALKLNEETLPEAPNIQLDDWVSIAQSAAALTPLVSLNMLDDETGEISYVGRLTGVEHDALILQEVDPNAHWYPDTGAYEFPAIGSIAFGTRYMLLLAKIAGVPPIPLPPEALPAS